MRTCANLLIAGALALCASGLAGAQSAGNVANGRVLSQRLCGDCHATDPAADSSPKSKAPTFAKIADTPGMTGMALSAWLHSSHRTMPLVRLGTRTREDISAYILSLKASPAERG
jgi:mono/diheme cytochrome c family protein